MNVQSEVLAILDEILHLGPRAEEMHHGSPLLGAVPELDSMAVVAILTTFEERFGFTVDDDEVDGQVFGTLGTLSAFVNSKLAR